MGGSALTVAALRQTKPGDRTQTIINNIRRLEAIRKGGQEAGDEGGGSGWPLPHLARSP
jgi:hypothetical protein